MTTMAVYTFFFCLTVLCGAAHTQQQLPTANSSLVGNRMGRNNGSLTMHQQGNNFTFSDDAGRQVLSMEFNRKDFGDLARRNGSSGLHERMECPDQNLVATFVEGLDEKNAMKANHWSIFKPTECRSQQVNKWLDGALQVKELGAFVVVNHNDCKKLRINALQMCRVKLHLTCSYQLFKYDAVLIPMGQKARFRYSGLRGFNMWGNVRWTECSATNKVVNYACDGEDIKNEDDGCV